MDKSQEIMKGNKGKYFLLIMSFIGWYIVAAIVGYIITTGVNKLGITALNIITTSIGFIILTPYIKMTTLEFYEGIKNVPK